MVIELPAEEHRLLARGIKVRFCLLVTSDAVYEGRRADELTPLAKELISASGHELIKSVVVPNNTNYIRKLINELLSSECDVVVTTGGTGISRKDLTVDVVKEFCIKELLGYGELFRYLTYLRHGAVAIASRATACVTEGHKLIFTTPGSKDAFELAMKELILPEIKHLIMELRR